MIKVIPVGDRLLIKRGLTPEKTKGGIVIPETSRMNTEVARVVFVSPDVKDFKEGDMIVCGKYSGVSLEIEGEEFCLLRIEDIVGKICEVKCEVKDE
jgi:chaperonin GroES